MVRMDLDDFRTILDTAGMDVWSFIDAAMEVASVDYGNQLKQRRDAIMERLYALTSPPSLPAPSRCKNCEPDHQLRQNQHQQNSSHEFNNNYSSHNKGASQSTPQSDGKDDDGLDPFAGLFDDEQKKILEIKEELEIPDQSEDNLVELLQSLADMDITFQALKETDIGRHVNRLRKNSSNEVRRLVKHLVRKWKDIVDDWVRLYQPAGEHNTSTLIADGDSPQEKVTQNGHHHQVPDFAYSPNLHNRNNSENKPKPNGTIARREAPPKSVQAINHYASASSTPQNRHREQKESIIDADRLASARKRLHDSYKEAENAKKQRTIQVMDIHDIPKPKNTFFSKNKGGGSQGRHW